MHGIGNSQPEGHTEHMNMTKPVAERALLRAFSLARVSRAYDFDFPNLAPTFRARFADSGTK
jgi:hypothetical protein